MTWRNILLFKKSNSI